MWCLKHRLLEHPQTEMLCLLLNFSHFVWNNMPTVCLQLRLYKWREIPKDKVHNTAAVKLDTLTDTNHLKELFPACGTGNDGVLNLLCEPVQAGSNSRSGWYCSTGNKLYPSLCTHDQKVLEISPGVEFPLSGLCVQPKRTVTERSGHTHEVTERTPGTTLQTAAAFTVQCKQRPVISRQQMFFFFLNERLQLCFEALGLN